MPKEIKLDINLDVIPSFQLWTLHSFTQQMVKDLICQVLFYTLEVQQWSKQISCLKLTCLLERKRQTNMHHEMVRAMKNHGAGLKVKSDRPGFGSYVRLESQGRLLSPCDTWAETWSHLHEKNISSRRNRESKGTKLRVWLMGLWNMKGASIKFNIFKTEYMSHFQPSY